MGQVIFGTQVSDMTYIFSSALRVSTGVTLSIGPSSYTSSPLPELFALLASSTREWDERRSDAGPGAKPI